jgi:uncharacterized protein YgiB involved in biofilm formation
MIKKISLTLAMLSILAACGDNQQPVAQYPQAQPTTPQPVIVNQAPAQSTSATDMLVGGMAGYMVGQALSSRSAQPVQPQVIEKRTYIVQDRPAVATPQAPAARPAALAAPVKQFAVPQTQVAPKNAITSVPSTTKPSYTWSAPPTSKYGSTSSYSSSRTTFSSGKR